MKEKSILNRGKANRNQTQDNSSQSDSPVWATPQNSNTVNEQAANPGTPSSEQAIDVLNYMAFKL